MQDTATRRTCTNTMLLVAWSALLARRQNYVQFALQPFFTGGNEEAVETWGWFVVIPVFAVTAVRTSKS